MSIKKIGLIIGALLILTAGYLFVKINESFELHDEIIFEIKKGSSIKSLARELEEKEILKNKFFFEWYIRIVGLQHKIQLGVYQIPKRFSIPLLAEIFSSGKVATKVLTLQEGRTSWEYYKLLSNHFDIDSLIFDSLVLDPGFVNSCGISANSLEGYLFPETYHFPFNSDEKTLLTIMVKQFKAKIKSLNLSQSIVYKKYGIHGLMTLASIVEEEAMVAHERHLIAGVFYNRLVKNWPLGADPTVRFIYRKLTGPLFVSELLNPSPYNTRINLGLPPGPISNPGLGAIEAAAHPQSTPFMYFVAKDDGSREHNFSKTNKEHIAFKKVRSHNQKIQEEN